MTAPQTENGQAPGSRSADPLASRNRIGCDRDGAGLAYFKLPAASGSHLFAEDVPADDFSGLGGLEPQKRAIQRAIDFRFKHPRVAQRYQLHQRQGILLE